MKHWKAFSACLLALPFLACSPQREKDNVEAKVEALLEQMTLQEKIGQMNQISPSGNIDEIAGLVKEGKVGSFLNVTDPVMVNKVQKIAVEESRLGIPILMSRDVIHG